MRIKNSYDWSVFSDLDNCHDLGKENYLKLFNYLMTTDIYVD